MDLYGLVVRMELLEGHETDFDALVSETLGDVKRSEPGTLCYLVHAVAGSARSRVLFELYRDETAFEAHEHSSHVRRFLEERASHLACEPEVWRVTPAQGTVRAGLVQSFG